MPPSHGEFRGSVAIQYDSLTDLSLRCAPLPMTRSLKNKGGVSAVVLCRNRVTPRLSIQEGAGSD
ncbi:MAG: hypothetical protein JJU46_06220 [Balneolaceae bacterium]|nr:hypothetical protein [Balneolaceae bacterium]